MSKISIAILLLMALARIAGAQDEDLIKRAGQLASRGSIDSSRALLDSALAINIKAGDTAAWARNIGKIGRAYSRIELGKTAKFYQEYIALGKDHFGTGSLALAELYARIGDIYRKPSIGEFFISSSYFDSAITIFQEQGIENRFTGFVYHFAGNIHTRIGSYAKSVTYLNKSLEIREAHGDTLYAAQVLNDLGILSTSMGSYSKAEEQFELALEYLKKLRSNSKTEKLQATLTLNVADVYVKEHKHEIDLAGFLEPARMMFEEQGDLSGLSAIERSIGQWLTQNGQAYKAVEHLIKSLELSRQKFGAHHRDLAKGHIALAKAYALLSNRDSVFSNVSMAFRCLIPSFKPENYLENPAVDLLYAEPWLLIGLQEKASQHYQSFQSNQQLTSLKQSYQTYLLAIEQMDLLRDQYQYETDKIRLFGEFQEVIVKCILIARELHEITVDDEYLDAIFNLQQKTKAYALKELFYGLLALDQLKIPTEFMAQERSLKSEIAYLAGINGLQENDSVQSRLGELQAEFEKVVRQIKEEYPTYFDIKYQDDVLSPEHIEERILTQDEVMLQYLFAGDSLLCFVSGTGLQQLFLLKPKTGLKERILNFQGSLNIPNFTLDEHDAVKRLALQANALYQELLAPIDSFLQIEYGHLPSLLIIPDGHLHYIPFEALVEKPYTGEQKFKELHFLLKRRNIRYAFSASVLNQQYRPNAKTYTSNMLAFAPWYGSTSKPKAGSELEAIEKLISGNYHRTGGSGIADFKQQVGDSKILHLATHGMLNSTTPLLSSISFSESKTDSGHLYAYELIEIPIRAELVVLAACQTGIGPLEKGEGMLTLGRSFAYAGCRSSVVGMWSVNDNTTAETMVYFYENIKAGMPKHEALRMAQLKYLDNNDGIKTHPYFWAGLVFNGNASAIELGLSPNGYSWKMLLGIALFLTLLTGVLIRAFRVKARSPHH